MTYRVVVTATAERAIAEQVTFIAHEQQEPLNAARVLGAIDEAIDSLSLLPHRCGKAPEDNQVGYTVRMRIVKKSFVILYRVDDTRRQVTVVGFRHGRQLPRTDLPGE